MRRSAVVGLVGAVGAAVLLWPQSGSGITYFPFPSDDPTVAPLTTLDHAPSTRAAAEDAVAQGSATAEQLKILGFGGRGFVIGAPKHRLRVVVSSAVAAGTVGYVIPTSVNRYYGKVTAGSHWSLSTAVFGSPDYARVFVQAGSRGTPVTCAVYVDGKLTDRRTTSGPYGQAMCQG